MSAAEALKRANTEKATLSRQTDIAVKELQAAQTESSIALPRLPPLITGIKPDSINPASPVPVTLTVSNVNDNITRFDLKVKLDGVAIQVDAPPAATGRPNVYEVRFMTRKIRHPLDLSMDIPLSSSFKDFKDRLPSAAM